MDGSSPETCWTAERVELRLIAAYRMMPACPVLRIGRTIRTSGDQRTPLTDVLEWGALLGNRHAAARTYLFTWARCRATRESFAERCRDQGWPLSTAEDGRRRAARIIAEALNADAQAPKLNT